MINQVFPYGKLKIVTISGAAGATAIDIRPPAGKQWLILDLWANHNDAVARDAHFNFYDGTTTVFRYFELALTQNTLLPFNKCTGGVPSPIGWLIISRDVYLQFQVAAITASAWLTAAALVLESTYT